MLTRIVRMTFHKNKVSSFLELFEERKRKIRSFDGCAYLSLHRENRYPNVYFTVSRWRDEAALQAYRESVLFRATWKKTKSWFADRPKAWSLEEITTLE